jgi:hypothetical protein
MVIFRIGVVVALGLCTGAVRETASLAQSASQCVNGPATRDKIMGAHASVATAEQPALVLPTAGPISVSNSPALRVTLRPTKADPNSPFLVQIFANDCETTSGSPEQLLGVVSFFHLRLGKSEDFVVTAPQSGFPPILFQNVQLIVKLVPANPAESLVDASVEVDGAHFVD